MSSRVRLLVVANGVEKKGGIFSHATDEMRINHRIGTLSTGRTYHFVDQLLEGVDPATGLTILCVHGFPDLWYGWRHQIGPWTRRGYRVVVPDMLGYGGTDKPMEAIEYTTKRLSDDLAALLDYIGVQKAIVIGHDWGAYTAGRFALWHPSRLLALVMLSVPFTPPNRTYVSLKEVARRFPELNYQTYLASPKATGEIEANLADFFTTAFRVPTGEGVLPDKSGVDKQPSILDDKELEYYISTFRWGMDGPLTYYRTSKLRYEEEKAAQLSSSFRPDLPVLFIWGTLDPIAIPIHIERAQNFIPNLQNIPVQGKGHWIMVEAKDEVTKIVVDWLNAQNIVPSKPRL